MAEKKVPMRMCVVCRTMKDKRELLRVVRTPEGEVRIDERGKMNGRGAYVCSDPKCRAKCVKTKFFNKLFGMPVPEEIYAALAAPGERNGTDKV